MAVAAAQRLLLQLRRLLRLLMLLLLLLQLLLLQPDLLDVSAQPNPSHPLFQKAAELGVLLHELEISQKAAQVLVTERRRLTASL